MSLEDISRRTKISVERLSAIERGDLEQLPPLVYLNGFVRAYAAEVHLDADDVARRYLTELEDAAAVASRSAAAASEDPLNQFDAEAELRDEGRVASMPPPDSDVVSESAHERYAEPSLSPQPPAVRDATILRVTSDPLTLGHDPGVFDSDVPHSLFAGAPPRRRSGAPVVIFAVAVVAGVLVSANYERIRSEFDRIRSQLPSPPESIAGNRGESARDRVQPRQDATPAARAPSDDTTAATVPETARATSADGTASDSGAVRVEPERGQTGSAARRSASDSGGASAPPTTSAARSGASAPTSTSTARSGGASAAPGRPREAAPDEAERTAARGAAPPNERREAREAPARGDGRAALPARATADREPAPGDRESGTAAATASDDVSGWWTLTNRVESTSYGAYNNLNLGYRVRLEQHGDRITGAGQKWMENGKALPPGRRTPITIEGTRNGGRLELNFREKGARRESGGMFVMEVAGDGTLYGTFVSDAANSRGSSRARRADTPRN